MKLKEIKIEIIRKLKKGKKKMKRKILILKRVKKIEMDQ